jgi:two-component system response regulator RegA
MLELEPRPDLDKSPHMGGTAPTATAALLLVDHEPGSRRALQHGLGAIGFAVTGVGTLKAAQELVAATRFDFAAIELRLGDGNGIELVKQLRGLDAATRIVVVTGFDSFASVIVALGAGAVDYLPKPVKAGDLANALVGHTPIPPDVPDMPLAVERVCWEHIQRIFEQCDRNVSVTARCLRMHRRTLQRMLGKRAPRPRAQ